MPFVSQMLGIERPPQTIKRILGPPTHERKAQLKSLAVVLLFLVVVVLKRFFDKRDHVFFALFLRLDRPFGNDGLALLEDHLERTFAARVRNDIAGYIGHLRLDALRQTKP